MRAFSIAAGAVAAGEACMLSQEYCAHYRNQIDVAPFTLPCHGWVADGSQL